MAEKLPPGLRDDPLFLTTRAALVLTARCRRALRAHGIDDVNPAQLGILFALDERDGITASQLAREVMYEKSTLTPLLHQLEAAGLLLRARDPKDGRVQRLFLTRLGRKRRREVEPVLAGLTGALLAALPRKVLRHHVEFCQSVLDGGHEHPRG